jgi:hypothetical protein
MQYKNVCKKVEKKLEEKLEKTRSENFLRS